jgi:hypothetical protein
MIFILSGSTIGTSSVDSARQNLASSFVNGFVNAAFGQDKLPIVLPERIKIICILFSRQHVMFQIKSEN